MSGSRHLCFPDQGPLVVDNCEACPTDSESAWSRRFGSSGSHLQGVSTQRGGGNSNNKDKAMREFLNVLMRVLVSGNDDPVKTKEECEGALEAFVNKDFEYNGKPGRPDLLCSHLLSLYNAFPQMDVSVNMFRDSTTKTAVFIILVSGKMEGPWLNRSASNKHEHLGIAIHIEATRGGEKIKKATFRSEFLSPETYQAIRALDLVFTAFSLDEQGKRSDEGNTKKVETPVKMVAVLNRQDEGKRFDEELAEARREMARENAFAAKEVVPEMPADVNTERRATIDVLADQANIKNVRAELRGDMSEETAALNALADGTPTPSQLISLQRLRDRLLGQVQTGGDNVQHQAQRGGDGYYAAVEQVPIAGQPVYQGYSSCCPPYFTTDGTNYTTDGYPYNVGCQDGGERNMENMEKSVVLKEMRDGTVKAMANAAKDHIKHKNKKKLHNVIEENVTQAIITLAPSVSARKSNTRLLSKQQGGVLGGLGTLIFPDGITAGVVPWLLLLGAKLSQKIEQDSTRGKPRKTAHRTNMKTKQRQRAPKDKKRTKSRKKRTPTRVIRRPAARRELQEGRRGWRPLSNAEIRRLMREKRQRGGAFPECWSGDCITNLCGDASLRPFAGCKRPTWGPKCM